mgnify:CR=1 FL=1
MPQLPHAEGTLGDFMSVAEAARELGLTPGNLRRLLAERKGRLVLTRKLGRDWMIARQELDLLRPGPVGRPKKGAG